MRPWQRSPRCSTLASRELSGWSDSFLFTRGSNHGGRLAMRFLISFAGMLVVASAAVPVRAAQTPPPLDRTVTLALDRVSLKDALDEVARQTGVRIAYSRRVVPLDRPVAVQLDAVPGAGAAAPGWGRAGGRPGVRAARSSGG